MRNPFGGRTITVGIAGIVLGGLAEALINRLVGTTVITDGIMWGAVLAILASSLPNFARMGSLAVKSERPIINVAVGAALFLLISVLVVGFFYVVFLVFGRILT
jgi:hypothetical protein